MVLRNRLCQPVELLVVGEVTVAPGITMVFDKMLERRHWPGAVKRPLLVGHHEYEPAARLELPPSGCDRADRVSRVLDHVTGNEKIEAAIGDVFERVKVCEYVGDHDVAGPLAGIVRGHEFFVGEPVAIEDAAQRRHRKRARPGADL